MITVDYEHKYKDALERAKKLQHDNCWVTSIFPELAESEDEGIRKFIIDCIQELRKSNQDNSDFNSICGDAIAWLEKQKEQKPLSTEETELNSIAFLEQLGYTCVSPGKEQKPAPKFSVGDYVIDTNYKGEPLYQIVGIGKECYICEYRGDNEMGDRAVMHFTFDNPYLRLKQKPAEWSEEKEKAVDNYADEIIKWEDAHKDWDRQVIRATAYHFFTLQSKQEWSEEDENNMGWLIAYLRGKSVYHSDELHESVIKWLKSLRPQHHWKPSEEQMDILDKVYHYLWVDRNATADMQDGLGDFIDDLKKLM